MCVQSRYARQQLSNIRYISCYSTRYPSLFNSLATTNRTMSHTILITSLLLLTSACHATIPSTGIITAEHTRNSLPDSAFKFNLDSVEPISSGNWSAKIFDLRNSPALGAVDVQWQMADGRIKPGNFFFRHYHPRSTELVYVLAGKMRTMFKFEGPNPRKVTNVVGKGDFTIIPQGLIHQFKCISSEECYFLAIFRTADPGLVFLWPTVQSVIKTISYLPFGRRASKWIKWKTKYEFLSRRQSSRSSFSVFMPTHWCVAIAIAMVFHFINGMENLIRDNHRLSLILPSLWDSIFPFRSEKVVQKR